MRLFLSVYSIWKHEVSLICSFMITTWFSELIRMLHDSSRTWILIMILIGILHISAPLPRKSWLTIPLCHILRLLQGPRTNFINNLCLSMLLKFEKCLCVCVLTPPQFFHLLAPKNRHADQATISRLCVAVITHHKPLPKNICHTHGWPQHWPLFMGPN